MRNRANEIKKEIVLYSKILDEKGLVNSLEGNLSIMDRESGLLYITPSGTRKRFLDEDMVAVVKGQEQVGGSVKKSSEYLLHEAALKARPDCSAVAHLHAPYLTAYAYCNKTVRSSVPLHFHLYLRKSHACPTVRPEPYILRTGLRRL